MEEIEHNITKKIKTDSYLKFTKNEKEQVLNALITRYPNLLSTDFTPINVTELEGLSTRSLNRFLRDIVPQYVIFPYCFFLSRIEKKCRSRPN